jgi:hypothetical protein
MRSVTEHRAGAEVALPCATSLLDSVGDEQVLATGSAEERSISMQLNPIPTRSPRQWRGAREAANEPVRAIDAERYSRVALTERRVTQTVVCSRDRSGGIVEVV